jgi:hypothetical protein
MSTDRDWRTVFRRYARLLMRSPSIPELGNAKGLPMPSTPDALQGLSQRRRNRCRCLPSCGLRRDDRDPVLGLPRKKARDTEETLHKDADKAQPERATSLAQDALPAAAPGRPAKSYFSSPASDTFSDQLIRISPRSPAPRRTRSRPSSPIASRCSSAGAGASSRAGWRRPARDPGAFI